MPEFPDYYTPMDRQYHGSMPEERQKKIEEPIFPIQRLGATVPEIDRAGRFKNFVQHVQATMRSGVGQIQLVLETHPDTALGGYVKAYGKEVREALREIQKANDAMIVGIEMPTSFSNLTGMDPQGRSMTEEKRREQLEAVRDAINFAAEATQGGGVDMVSFEFQRPFFDQKWNKQAEPRQKLFELSPDEEKKASIQFVDERTGALVSANLAEGIPLPLSKNPKEAIMEQGQLRPGETGVDPDTGLPKVEMWGWTDFLGWAKENAKKAGEEDPVLYAKKLFKDQLLRNQEVIAEAQARSSQRKIGVILTHTDLPDFEEIQDPRQAYNKFMELGSEKRKQIMDEVPDIRAEVYSAEAQWRNMEESKKRRESLVPIEVEGKNKAWKSYAEAGIMAMEATHRNRREKQPVFIGPEIGWPQFYGGHPDEFIELIKKSREKMVDLLIKPIDEKGNPNKYYDPTLSQKEAEEQAKQHIKGTFDTGHMGMWFRHFRPDLSYDERLTEFKKWYLEQSEKLAKSDVVGTIQLVDTATGAHAHLPPGQGMLPIFEAAKEFQKKKFSGYLIAEGHEEEKFNEGRIFLKTWEEMGFVPAGYFAQSPSPKRWGDVQSGYFGRTYAPKMMFGSYAPPFGEYKPWSEIPFE